MTKKTTASIADIADRHRQYMAFGMFAVGLIYLIKAVELIAPAEMELPLEVILVTLAILTIALIAPMFVWKFRLRTAGERIVYFSKDGYAAQALEAAKQVSWVTTFLILALVESMDRLRAVVPEQFFIKIILAIMLCTMSCVFLYKTRSEGSSEFEDGDE